MREVISSQGDHLEGARIAIHDVKSSLMATGSLGRRVHEAYAQTEETRTRDEIRVSGQRNHCAMCLADGVLLCQ
jgi:lipopolysaccharide export system protein LptA